MSKPSTKVLSFKERVIEKIERFAADVSSLSELTFAHYKLFPRGIDSMYHSAEFHRKRKDRIKLDAMQRKHGRHVMRSDHRKNCVSLLKLLVHRLDLNTLECVLVAPSYGVRRPLYVNEMATQCGVSLRTLQSCLQSLAVAGYIRRVDDKSSKRLCANNTVRNLHRIFLTPSFFEAIQSNIALSLLKQYLLGLSKKARKKAQQNNQIKKLSKPVRPANSSKKTAHEKVELTAEEKERRAIVGNHHIALMRKGKPPD